MWISKKYIAIGFIIFIVIISLITLSYYNFSYKNEAREILKCENLKNGDLILRCGRSTASFAVYLADTKAEFSHIGIISVENNIHYVIHAVPCNDNFIKKEKLIDFINPNAASSYAVYRANCNPSILKKVVKQAQIFYNNKYIFDNNYDLTTNTKLYCTELVLKAFKNGGLDLHLNTKKLNLALVSFPILFPSEFTKSPLFNKIY